ncbi:MAG: HI0074 family nucleotidyltransferase substrate-binding subunit [Terriglobales bacterium]
MDRLKLRLDLARRALRSFRDIMRKSKTDIVRDAAIKRFEYTFEAMWKAAQLYLSEKEGLQLASPKSVIRACGQTGILAPDQVRVALTMADDRNLTVHTYNEPVADVLYGRLAAYGELLWRWLKSMAARAAATP